LGPGAIGSEVGRLLQAFGVTTIGCNRSGKAAPHMDEMVSFTQLTEALPKADIVISVLPKTEETTHLLKEEHFSAMKNEAIFMNFGRGNLVDEKVLIHALETGEIGYAVLDVFEKEPLSANNELHSDIHHEYLKNPQCLVFVRVLNQLLLIQLSSIQQRQCHLSTQRLLLQRLHLVM